MMFGGSQPLIDCLTDRHAQTQRLSYQSDINNQSDIKIGLMSRDPLLQRIVYGAGQPGTTVAG